jgi:hypothetical protein
MNSNSNIFNSYYTIPTNNTDYASWQPTAATNNNILTENNLTSNWKYRQYIQKNANQIMKYNSMAAIHASGNNPYVSSSSSSSNINSMSTPYLFDSIYATNANTINNSDLKQAYLQKVQMSARMVAPTINTNNFSNNKV